MADCHRQAERSAYYVYGQIRRSHRKNTPLLWERIEHLTQSVKCVLGEGSSRRVSNCKIKKFRVGLVNPTYKTLNFPHPLREGARGWGLISSRRENVTRHTALDVAIAVPPQRGRLGGVQPVGLTSLIRHSEKCEFTPEAIQKKYPLRREGGLLVSCNNFPLLMRENCRVRFNAPQPTTKEVFQC